MANQTPSTSTQSSRERQISVARLNKLQLDHGALSISAFVESLLRHAMAAFTQTRVSNNRPPITPPWYGSTQQTARGLFLMRS